MKKEVILVPRDKCPLDVLAEMGERTKNAWIFLHRNACENLFNSSGVNCKEGSKGYYVLTWEATKEYPKTEITINFGVLEDWKPLCEISAQDISFKYSVSDPEEIFFLKMDN